MPFLSAIVQVVDSVGTRVDRALADGTRQIISLKLSSAFAAASTLAANFTEVALDLAAAAGDLTGSWPSITVAKVNGTTVPATASGSTDVGKVLTVTSAHIAAWQTPSGGFLQHKFASLATQVTAVTAVFGTPGAWVSLKSVTMTTAAGSKVVIQASASVYNNSAEGRVEAQLFVDGVATGPIMGTITPTYGAVGDATPINSVISLIGEATGLSAASHTFEVKFRPAYFGSAYCDATQTQGGGSGAGAARGGGATILAMETAV